MNGKFRRRGLVVGGLAAAVLALAAGIAYAAIPDASSKVFTACMLKNFGTIRLIDPALGSGSLLGKCSSLETQISWNQKGQAGVSPTVSQLAAGDANCPAGGAAITDAAGSTAYVCSGEDGQDGQDGQDGADFTGSFASPNGLSTLNVDDTGIELHTPGGQLNLGTVDAELKSATQLRIEAATQLILRGATVAIN